MPVFLKLGNREIKLDDMWDVSPEEVGKETLEYSEYMKELVQEDLGSFLEQIQFMDHCEFYYRDKP